MQLVLSKKGDTFIKMAMVKKLSLQGVRSFSPADNRGQWIEFGTPLTLILGVNGSGKTVSIFIIVYL